MLESQRNPRRGHCPIQVNNRYSGEFLRYMYPPSDIDRRKKKKKNYVLIPLKVAGMLLYYILSDGRHPFEGSKSFQLESNIHEGKYSLDDVKDVVAKDLIEWMINKEPTERPQVKQCLSHPFFWGKER